ncbi:MAG TPA: ATP-binding protein [Acidobacteriota bacterium]|nr:ATP-binding protein [Acidobacteriota bacterium]
MSLPALEDRSSAPKAGAKDTERLRQAFDSFAEISSSLEKAYGDLQAKVRSLSRQLEESNDYLETVLQSLPCGVLVVDGQERVKTLNRQARELLGLQGQVWGQPSEGSLSTSRGSCPALPSLRELIESIPCGQDFAVLFSRSPAPREITLQQPRPRHLACAFSSTKRGERLLVLQDITELRRLQERMRRQERLAAMGEMAFEVAHEIRNPLTGLGLFASLLREDDLSPEERNRFVDNIEIGIRTLDVTLTNMLCFSRRKEPDKQPLDLAALLQTTLDFMSPVAQERGIELRTRFESRALVEADEEMMRQVFMNLVLNALQAQSRGGSLEAGTQELGESLQVHIRDSGPGYRQDGNAVFEPRFATDEKGRGLGLGVVKKVVEAHGGEVRLSSRQDQSGRGGGNQFTLIFPLGAESR